MTDGFITKGNWNTFLMLDKEELLLVRRKHFFVVAAPILFTSTFAALFLFVVCFFFLNTFYSPPLLFISILLIVSIALSFITKSIIDWFFHLYVLTNRKLLEVWYTPLASHVMSEVLLDKVNCTEVDVRMNGFVHELLDMGDVVITFDRPTHQEEFVLNGIEQCDKVGKFLTQELINHETSNQTQTIWLRRPSNVLARY